MSRHAKDIERILKDECELFGKLYSLEELKTGAILEHKGKFLEHISHDQEAMLKKLQDLETERLKKMEAYERAGHSPNNHITLKAFAESMGGADGNALTATAVKLGGIINKFNSLLETNGVLITDNMEYYNLLLTGLRANGTNDPGYRPDGKEKEVPKQSILFNQTA